MAKLNALVWEIVEALMITVIGYILVFTFITVIAAAMDPPVVLPGYFTTLGLGIVFIMLFFGMVIYVVKGVMHSGGKD